jgi:hypothetical protein
VKTHFDGKDVNGVDKKESLAASATFLKKLNSNQKSPFETRRENIWN